MKGPGGLGIEVTDTSGKVTLTRAAAGSLIRDEVLAVPIFLEDGGVRQLRPILRDPAGLLGRDTDWPGSELLTIGTRNTEPEPDPESRLDLSSAALSNSLAEEACPEPTLELVPVMCEQPENCKLKK